MDKNNRKKGIGTLLINEFIKRVKGENVEFVKLNAFSKNIPAVSLYEKLGFEEYSVFYMKDL